MHFQQDSFPRTKLGDRRILSYSDAWRNFDVANPRVSMRNQEVHPGSQAMAGGSHGSLAKAYFRLKPYVPRSVRWALRRIRTQGIIKRNTGVWPIDRTAGEKPQGWKGWPTGSRFALVFTHDVESGDGIRKVKSLAELDMEFGFKASFNFIPEGPYEDPAGIREWLCTNGFEVGVHDLKHDGHLYESRDGFSRKAECINEYLHQWGAVGFRSGFMLHQLDWLHDLNVLYDASTFDTDPFEPQPEGSHTIFPFHVKPPLGDGRPGYVELSYTLPQDSTLFILMRERTPEIWKQKLDWVAKKGGLALVNIHPDYIDFSDESHSSSHYPVAIVREFMEYIQQKYGGMFWNPLARDLAYWYLDEIQRFDASIEENAINDGQR